MDFDARNLNLGQKIRMFHFLLVEYIDEGLQNMIFHRKTKSLMSLDKNIWEMVRGLVATSGKKFRGF